MIELLRRNPDFRAVFVAQVVSYAGDWFVTVALLGLVLELTRSPLAATLVFVSQTLPAFLMAPLAGTAADRFDRRRLMIVVSVLQVVAAASLLLVGPKTVWLVFVAQAAISALGAFFLPASQAAIPNLVELDDLPTATVMMSSTWGAMLAVGAALGGAFTVAFGRRASFVADGLSFVIAALLIASVRRSMNTTPATLRPAGRIRPLADTAESIRYARGRPEVLALLCSKMGFGLSGGVAGLLPVFATQSFRAGDAGTGILLGARGLGVVAGPLLVRRLVLRGVSPILAACGFAGLVFGAGYAVAPLAPSLALAAVAVLVAHLGGGSQWTLSTYGLQITTVDEFRGRIFAADFALVTLTMSVSFTLAGAAAARYGPAAVTEVLAGTAALWGVAYLLLTRTLRSDPSTTGGPAAGTVAAPTADPP